MTDTLYKRLSAAGCEISHRLSTLYVKSTPEAYDILGPYFRENPAYAVRCIPFKNPRDGRAWLEIPFAYDPYWEDITDDG